MRKYIHLFLLLFISLNAAAQTASFTSVKKLFLRNSDAIIENDEVKGYFSFYFVDKESKKEYNYMLNIMDNSMKVTYSVELTKPKSKRLLECAYNGERFCFSFIDFKEKSMEYLLLDKQGKTVASHLVNDLSPSEINYIYSMASSEDAVYSGGLASVGTKGFVRYGMEKGKGYRIIMEMFDNNGKSMWTATSGATSKKSYESVSPMLSSEGAVVSLITMRPKLMSSKFSIELVFINPQTGKLMFKVPTVDAKYNYQPVGVTYDIPTNSYFVYGEYFNLKDNVLKDKSQGFYFQTISNSGKLEKQGYCSWNEDVARVIPMNSKGKFADGMSVTIHNMVRTSDGKIFAIGEQFKKAASAGGIALNVLAGSNNTNVSVVEAQINDMMIFQFDENYKLEKVEVVDKVQSKDWLPKGWEFLSTPTLGYLMKSYGWFDYVYTSMSPDKKTFNVAYINYDKKKGEEGSNYVVGSIAYGKDKTIVSSKLRLSKKPTSYNVMPAKPGYVAIIEYYRKEKKIEFRLEKMNN
jgi:hypothetical protein